MEDYAYIVDFIPFSREGKPMVYLLGEKYFTLLQATLKPDAQVKLYERVFVGKGERDKIDRIKRKIAFSDLPKGAQENVFHALKEIVKAREPFFIAFLNQAGPISVRVHSLELIPGIGKRNLNAVLEERAKEPFKSFEDVKKRIPTWQDPVSSFAQRIFLELQGKEKHHLFVIPYFKKG